MLRAPVLPAMTPGLLSQSPESGAQAVACRDDALGGLPPAQLEQRSSDVVCLCRQAATQRQAHSEPALRQGRERTVVSSGAQGSWQPSSGVQCSKDCAPESASVVSASNWFRKPLCTRTPGIKSLRLPGRKSSANASTASSNSQPGGVFNPAGGGW